MGPNQQRLADDSNSCKSEVIQREFFRDFIFIMRYFVSGIRPVFNHERPKEQIEQALFPDVHRFILLGGHVHTEEPIGRCRDGMQVSCAVDFLLGYHTLHAFAFYTRFIG